MQERKQLSLFGDEGAPPAGRRAVQPPPRERVGPADPGSALRELGAALPAALRLGTSSWSFPGWQGLVYDRAADAATLAREGLAAYALHPVLRAVGIDRTFYAPIAASDYARYARQVPDGFRFLVKAPAALTSVTLRGETGSTASNDRFLDAGAAVRDFIEPCLAGLGSKAGPLVFQFPPLGRGHTREPRRFVDALTDFLLALPRLGPGPFYAVEVRDPELLVAEFFGAIEAAGAHYCLGVHARMPGAAEQGRMAARRAPGPLVVRWNLGSGLRYEEAKARYAPFDRLVDEDPATRDALADLALRALAASQPVYLIANNKAEGSAPCTLIALAEAIRSRIAG